MVLLGLALGRCSLKESLPSVFSSWAAFSGMEETGTLFVGDVLHEAFIAVNEEGIEAAAATAMPFVLSLLREILAERSFVFLIRDSGTGTILSLGRVVDPGG